MTGSYQRIAEPFNIPLKTPTALPGFHDQWNHGFKTSTGNSTFGAASAGRRSPPTITCRPGLRLRRRARHPAGRPGPELRAAADRPGANQAAAGQRRTPAGNFECVAAQLEARFRQTELDYDQAPAICGRPRPRFLPLAIDARQAENLLCVLMGMPPADLEPMLGSVPIPTAPPEVAIGIPADLLRRRPDVRRNECLAAAQAEQIGIALTEIRIRLSPSTATWAIRPKTFPICSRPLPSTARSALRSNGTC